MRSMTVYNFLLESSLWGSVLIIAAFIARAVLRRGIGSRAVYLAWLLVAARLLIPIALPNPLMNELRPTLSVDAGARPIADQLRTRFIDALDYITDALYPREQAENSPIRRFADDTDRGRTGNAALRLYSIGSVLAAACMLYRNARCRRRLWHDRVRALEGDEAVKYKELCALCRVKPVPVYYVDRISEARLVGAVKPFIAVPMGLSPDRLRLALIAELCHLRARDNAWAVIRCLCLIVHWLNPLVWLAAWYSRVDCELACDERTIALLNEPLQYANMLAECVGGSRAGICDISSGATMSGGAHRRRVSAAIRPRRDKAWLRALCAATGALVLTASFATKESYALPSVGEPPEVKWEAALCPIEREEDAIARARRFLESPFIDERTELMDIRTERREDGWLIYATPESHAMPATLWIDGEGRVLMYENYRTVGEIPMGVMQYAHQRPLESVREYLSAFFRAELPDAEYVRGHIVDDISAEDMRYINIEVYGDAEREGCFITLQIEPRARVLAYLGTGKPTPSDARIAPAAERLATFDLTEIHGMSHKQIDAGRFSTAFDEAAGAWHVDFTEADAEAPRLSWVISPEGEVLERSPSFD